MNFTSSHQLHGDPIFVYKDKEYAAFVHKQNYFAPGTLKSLFKDVPPPKPPAREDEVLQVPVAVAVDISSHKIVPEGIPPALTIKPPAPPSKPPPALPKNPPVGPAIPMPLTALINDSRLKMDAKREQKQLSHIIFPINLGINEKCNWVLLQYVAAKVESKVKFSKDDERSRLLDIIGGKYFALNDLHINNYEPQHIDFLLKSFFAKYDVDGFQKAHKSSAELN